VNAYRILNDKISPRDERVARLTDRETKHFTKKAASNAAAGKWERATELYEVASSNGTGVHALESMYRLALFREQACGGSFSSTHIKDCPLERDIPSALALYSQAARLGHSGAQMSMAVAMSSGVFVLGSNREVETLRRHISSSSNASFEDTALLQEYFAALGLEPLALMTLGWRHLHGHGVPISCDTALEYYEAAAEKSVVAIARQGVAKPNDRFKLTGDIASGSRIGSRFDRCFELFRAVVHAMLEFAMVKIEAILQRVHVSKNGQDQSAREVALRSQLVLSEPDKIMDDVDSISDTDNDPDRPYGTGPYNDDAFWGIGGSPERGSDVLRYYRHAAEQGDTQAEVALGHLHYFGTRNVKQDLNRAAELFSRAAKKGDVTAASWLGHMTARGLGVTQDQVIALKWLRIGVEAGDPTALNGLGLLELTGIKAFSKQGTFEADRQHSGDTGHRDRFHAGRKHASAAAVIDQNVRQQIEAESFKGHTNTGIILERDVNTATRRFQLASESGSADALYNLGMIHIGWDGLESSESRVFDQFLEGTTQTPARDSTSEVDASTLRRNVVAVNVHKALQYFSLAAQSGHLRAYHCVGKMYALGIGVSRSCDIAVNAFKVVAERGPWIEGLARAHASFRAGDTTAARLGYARLAHAGYEVAQSNAAWLLERLTERTRIELTQGAWWLFNHSKSGKACDGLSVQACGRRALALYRRAAKQGSADASLRLGDMYYNYRELFSDRGAYAGLGDQGSPHTVTYRGWNVSIRQLKSAVAYYQAAHELRSARASFTLGWCYQRGIGVRYPDFHLAKRHYELSVAVAADALWPARLALLLLHLESLTSQYLVHLPTCFFCGRYAAQFPRTLALFVKISLQCRKWAAILASHDILGAVSILVVITLLARARHLILQNPRA